MKVVIFGSGNVAHVLGKLLFDAGHEILQIIGRSPLATRSLAETLNAQAVFSWVETAPDADLYILAIGDQSLYHLDESVFLKGVVVHTAGSVPMSVLSRISGRFGILYPLQTLTITDVPGRDLPLLINGNNSDVSSLISAAASTISDNVAILDDDQRSRIHIAATIVNNFSNHLFALAFDFCQREGLDYSLLSPLIQKTASLPGDIDPATRQTGPAARHDMITIERHLEVLSRYPKLRDIYEAMTKSILEKD